MNGHDFLIDDTTEDSVEPTRILIDEDDDEDSDAVESAEDAQGEL